MMPPMGRTVSKFIVKKDQPQPQQSIPNKQQQQPSQQPQPK